MSSPVDPRASHPDAPDGKADKYALVELERRFLLAASPVGVPIRRWLIEDRYLRGTRIRLRRMTDLDEAAGATYKLTQKIPTGAGTPGLITTMYLSAAEYAALVTMPADTLRKIRSSFPPLGVDTFEGALHGLVLAEAEFENAADEARFRPSVPVVAEVTMDRRFAGGHLVTMGVDDVNALLVEFGIDR